VEQRQIAYYYNAVLEAEETDFDLDGDMKIPVEGEVVVRLGGKRWRVVKVTSRHNARCALPIYMFCLTAAQPNQAELKLSCSRLMFLRVVELRLHFPAPLLGIFVVHLLHLFCHIRVLFRNVITHLLNHLVPRIRRQLLVARAAQFPTSHDFHWRPPYQLAGR
jgi:hypothetical protein